MVNIETIRCMSMLETLATVSAKGYMAFSEYAQKAGEMDDEELPVIYDDQNGQELDGDRVYPVVLDADMDEDERLFITQDYDHYIDPEGRSAIVRAVIPADREDTPYIFVKLFGKGEEATIIVEDGAWFFDEEG